MFDVVCNSILTVASSVYLCAWFATRPQYTGVKYIADLTGEIIKDSADGKCK